MSSGKLVSVKTVKEAIAKLREQGDRPSNRKIRQILGGGSPNEIQAILKQIDEAEGVGVALSVELPDSLQSAILDGINTLISEATAELRNQVNATQIGQTEALDELEQAQTQLTNLKAQLEQYSDKLKVKSQQIESLEKYVDDLKVERQQLIEAGEYARTESAKAQMQLERADQAAAKCEARLSEVEKKLEMERDLRHSAEIRAAAAEARMS